MPLTRALIDPHDYPVDQVFLTAEECGRYNPQRKEFAQLTAVLHWGRLDNLMVAHRHVRTDEFWVEGHIPLRPLFPGVLMIESLAQTASIHCHLQFGFPDECFFGFGGVERFRFRSQVPPPCDLWIAGRIERGAPNQAVMRWSGQMLRADGSLVCEGTVIGVNM